MGCFPGLKSVPPAERPPVPLVFFAFRVMLAVGLFMIAVALYGAFLWWRGTLFETRWYLRIVAQCWWVGFIAVMSGWITTESGRQPWIVQGLLRTADASSPVHGGSVLLTLILFVLAYGVVFSFGIYYINRLIARGPEPPSEKHRAARRRADRGRTRAARCIRKRFNARRSDKDRTPWNGISP